MAFPKRGTAVAFAVCGLFLASCTPSQVVPTPSVSIPMSPSPSAPPTPTPTLSAQQQAAVEKVSAYFETLNAVFLDELSPNDLAKVARETALADAQRSYNELKNAGYTVSGRVDATGLIPSELTKKGSRATISVSFCQDTTGRNVTDKSGKRVVAGKVSSIVATVQQWAPDWYVTAFRDGGTTC